jgi:hypothetical protein
VAGTRTTVMINADYELFVCQTHDRGGSWFFSERHYFDGGVAGLFF